MITDNMENISKYSEITNDIAEFLKSLSVNTPAGHYKINYRAYANVDVYNTKQIEDCKFEAHKKYIDIQMILEGTEQLDFTYAYGLLVSVPYDGMRDVMFFENPERTVDSIMLEPQKFAFIFPHEAHKPQICIDGVSKPVKKVVVKILV